VFSFVQPIPHGASQQPDADLSPPGAAAAGIFVTEAPYPPENLQGQTHLLQICPAIT
jgi:hypothetical protein